MTPLTEQQVHDFREIVWDFYRANARSMPWRDDPLPYHVLVSEMMLQQTQVGRVTGKYQEFMQRFPTVQALSKASLAEVLSAWNGLGYNRRAKFLHAAAGIITQKHQGQIPDAEDPLVALPGIGHNTASAILAYAYNQPVVFIETNVRSVFFHHFFGDASDIDDKELMPLVEQMLDREHPREWYWALMDYGTHLKQTRGNNIARSKHYVRQSTFEGSRRQLRGEILRQLLTGQIRVDKLQTHLPDERLMSVLDDLTQEGLVERDGPRVRLTGQTKLP